MQKNKPKKPKKIKTQEVQSVSKSLNRIPGQSLRISSGIETHPAPKGNLIMPSTQSKLTGHAKNQEHPNRYDRNQLKASIGKEEVNVPLFTDKMTVYVERPMGFIKRAITIN